MDIDKPVILCCECGEPVEESWQLFCRKCYRRLKALPVEVKSVDRKCLSKDSSGRFICVDRHGRRYHFDGKGWRL